MEIKKYSSPCEKTPALDLIEEIFGEFERNLETPQLDGTETKDNDDFIYIATEGDTVLGMIHITIPTRLPYLAGVSGVCTTEAARGKGIGKALFRAAMDEIDRLGVKYSFLGTGNPIAAKMYSSFGFSYMQNSSVMIRINEGGVIDMNRDLYEAPVGNISISDEDASVRIPAVPLMLYLHSSPILDINISLVSARFLPQICCMSLYPRYIQLIKDGGRVLTAKDERGVPGAFASAKEDDFGKKRIDFFSVPSYEKALQDMINMLIGDSRDFYFEIADTDSVKIAILEKMGFARSENSTYKQGSVIIPTVKYTKA